MRFEVQSCCHAMSAASQLSRDCGFQRRTLPLVVSLFLPREAFLAQLPPQPWNVKGLRRF